MLAFDRRQISTADLVFGASPPIVAKAFDRKGMVLLCSSFSKSAGAGVSRGLGARGPYQAEVERLKFLNTVATPHLQQLVLAEYLESAGTSVISRACGSRSPNRCGW